MKNIFLKKKKNKNYADVAIEISIPSVSCFILPQRPVLFVTLIKHAVDVDMASYIAKY